MPGVRLRDVVSGMRGSERLDELSRVRSCSDFEARAREAFDSVELRPHVLRYVEKVALSAHVLSMRRAGRAGTAELSPDLVGCAI